MNIILIHNLQKRILLLTDPTIISGKYDYFFYNKDLFILVMPFVDLLLSISIFFLHLRPFSYKCNKIFI